MTHIPEPMTIAELARRLGQSPDWLYRAWDNLCLKDGMPRPLTSVTARGKTGSTRQNLKWDRQSIELWIQLRNPPEIRAAFGHAPARPANDAAPAATDSASDRLARRMV
jgi:hypothetical protein